MRRPRVILDTDIGTDIDDAAALLFALNSPEIDLAAVTCTYGRMDIRVPMVRQILRLAGREAIPVAAGCATTLCRNRPLYWAGFEGRGLAIDSDLRAPSTPEPAPDLIARLAAAHPGAVTLVPIGPLTNVATAIRQHPAAMAKLNRIVLMGGSFQRPGESGVPPQEHNTRSDPEAAAIVYGSGIPLSVVPLNVTLRTAISRGDVARVRATGCPAGAALADLFEVFFHETGRDATCMHDPLALALLVDPGVCRTERVRVTVNVDAPEGEWMLHARPEDRGPVEVCVDLDGPRFQSLLLERLTGSISGMGSGAGSV